MDFLKIELDNETRVIRTMKCVWSITTPQMT